MGIFNHIKTALLLGAMSGLVLVIGGLIGGQVGLFVALMIAVLMNFGTYWFSDKIVLKMYKAKPVNKREYPRLFNIVNDVITKANLPMPKVYVIESPNPNAFATGRNPEHSAIAVTTGILNILDENELKGVIAHEASHIKNRDILISTVAATLAAVVSYIAMMAQWAAIFGGFGRDNDNGGGLIELLVLMIVSPIIATIIQLGISRSREYLADSSGAKITGNPEGLASALSKLHKGASMYPFRKENQSGASLFIVNPFSAKSFAKLFSTHPPIEDRVRKLRNMRF